MCNAGDPGSIPGSGGSSGSEGDGYPLQYSYLENPMESGGLQSMGSQRAGYNNDNCLLSTNHGRYYEKCLTCAIC